MTAPQNNGEFPGSTPRPIPCPITQEFDGHGGICLTDAEGRQLGYISPHPNQVWRAAKAVEAIHDHDHLTAEVRRLQGEVAGLKGERDQLLSIKRLFIHDCNKIIELVDWSKEGNGNLDLEWAADQVGNALSNAHLIDIGAYRPGVFMPTGSEEAHRPDVPVTPRSSAESF